MKRKLLFFIFLLCISLIIVKFDYTPVKVTKIIADDSKVIYRYQCSKEVNSVNLKIYNYNYGEYTEMEKIFLNLDEIGKFGFEIDETNAIMNFNNEKFIQKFISNLKDENLIKDKFSIRITNIGFDLNKEVVLYCDIEGANEKDIEHISSKDIENIEVSELKKVNCDRKIIFTVTFLS